MAAKGLRARWATGPTDQPDAGEAVGRLGSIPGSAVHETVIGGGALGPPLLWDRATDTLSWGDTPKPSDLHVRTSRLQMSVTAGDGRTLVGHFGKDAAAPQIDADAPADLREAMNRLWRARKRSGPLPGGGLDMAAIRQALREWDGPWPPPQEQITAYSGRRVRQVLEEAGTSWDAEVDAAKP